LKQADVARMAGISQSMVARIESGSVDPRVSTLAKIVEVLQAAERSAITAADVMTSPVLFVVPGDPSAVPSRLWVRTASLSCRCLRTGACRLYI